MTKRLRPHPWRGSLPLATLLAISAPAPSRAQNAAPATASAAGPAVGQVEVSLQRLLEYAEQHAPELDLARSRRAYADAARAAAGPLLHANPTLELAAGPRFAGGGESGYDLHAALEQPIEIAGQRGARRELAQRMRERIERDVAVDRAELRRQITLAYRNGSVARARVASADDLVRFANEMLAIARRRYAAGDSGVIEVHVAETDAAQAQQSRLLAEQELTSARLTLCELTGWPIASPPLPIAGLEPPLATPALASALAAVRRAHPELLARRAAIAEADAELALQEREAWPTPSLGVELTREGNPIEGQNVILLGSLTVPLPFWQLNQEGRASARAERAVAVADERRSASVLLARIARAHAELQTAAARVHVLVSGVGASLETTLALLQKGFAAGELPIFEVALARERFLAARRDTLDAYADYYRALAEFERATGTTLPMNDSQGATP
jgi:cobalt-zinc-cadmium efflux system outer membrane protein